MSEPVTSTESVNRCAVQTCQTLYEVKNSRPKLSHTVAQSTLKKRAQVPDVLMAEVMQLSVNTLCHSFFKKLGYKIQNEQILRKSCFCL